MKKLVMLCLVLVFGFSLMAVAADVDKDAIKKQVDDIVVAIDGGKPAHDFKDAAKKDPYYVFIMEADGKLLVHPTLEGENLKTKAGPVYEAVSKATPAGMWVEYEWQGKQKSTYVRKAKGNLIVGSGYTK
jgi:hypothetical protein